MDTADARPLRVRFAPSPTGSLHVGGARTALFNWLEARHAGGAFILRLEDTDRERSTAESEAEILRVLTWMGLDWDEGPFRQSERDDIYRECIDRLKEAGAVYAAWETAEELDAMRAEARANKRAPVVRGRRDHTPEEIAAFEAEGRTPVWRFAVPLPGATVIDDMVRGEVTFDHAQIEDFVVARSDGSPTYNLAAAVEEMVMGVTRVIRGEDHISNTPKQMLMIRALGGEPPQYAHVPLILGTDRKRLSKRHGAASVEELEADGFLPQPVRNALVLLGWSYDDKTTTFTLDELVEKFDTSRISKSPAVFDLKKLEVMSGRYLRAMDPGEFADVLVGYLE
ncbi:MAG: glutamate--tRNA ligase, partial [Miltoncostaeaceae bacterium]